jgi:hypothetical protein
VSQNTGECRPGVFFQESDEERGQHHHDHEKRQSGKGPGARFRRPLQFDKTVEMQETVKTEKNDKKNVDSSHVSAPGYGFIPDESRDGGPSTVENGRYYNHSRQKTQTLDPVLPKNREEKKNIFCKVRG